MARRLKSDKWLFLAALLLVTGGIVMVYSASAFQAAERFHKASLYLTKQALWVALGLALVRLVMSVDYRSYRSPRVIWPLVIGVGLGLVVVLFMAPVSGARRWFGIGPLGGQPSELAKLAVIVFTAAVLERRMAYIDRPLQALTPIVVLLIIFTTLVLFEPDFGSAAMLIAIACAMVFAAGLPWGYLVGVALALIPAAASLVAFSPYRRRRLFAFLDPWSDPLGAGFQLIQSLIAVGTGGWTGKGLMQGVQKLHYLPEPQTDFIYAVIAEEFGLIGASIVLVAFGVIAWRGLRLAGRAPDGFGGLLAVGLTTMIAVQALLNISVVLGLVPTKGIPLPFVSAGGSSLLVQMIAVGILLNISQQASATS